MRALPVVLLLVLLAAPAGAAARLTPLTEGAEFVLSDGARWAVVAQGDGMGVIDGRASTPQVEHVALAAPCHAQFGIPRAIGSGYIAVWCAYSDDPLAARVLVYDIARRTFARRGVVRPAGDDRLFAYRKPYGLASEGPAQAPRLVLRRCGRQPVTLSRDRVAVESAQLGLHYVTWTTEGRVVTLRLASGQITRRPLPARRQGDVVPVVAAHELLVSVAATGTFPVFAARLP